MLMALVTSYIERERTVQTQVDIVPGERNPVPKSSVYTQCFLLLGIITNSTFAAGEISMFILLCDVLLPPSLSSNFLMLD